MPLSTKPYRGTRDFLPEEMSIRTQIFESLFKTAELFGFERYDGPIIEPAAIYEAKSGKEIVDEQMYRFTDKGGREIVLRPEMTPSVARMIAGHQADVVFPARWYSHINAHRYERPQRGRVREHWQLNLDIFGSEDLGAEIEMFELIAALLNGLGADPSMYVIRVNDRGLLDAGLRNYVRVSDENLAAIGKVIDRWEKIDDEQRSESLRGAGLDPEQDARLRALLAMDLASFVDVAGEDAASHSRIVRIIGERMTSVPLEFSPHIIRGFDYYTSTVFEVFDTSPDNRRSLFGGGRYDDLASLFTDRKIPGIGCGMGDVTVVDFLTTHGLLPKPDFGPDVYVFGTGDDLLADARRLTRVLRDAGIRSVPALGAMTVRAGVKFADRTGVRFAVIIGDNEQASGKVSLKNMQTSEQVSMLESDVARFVSEALAAS
ncbi:histidine--tRNA ligase [Cryobacterium sp. GrIS_2_6]|uniref:histidine--tRNA ligase n=1 Tax=Cryobacterium sp. GrIS_2_6 TaxID=3162785 RepID=UPI002E0536F9|nr:histidine--tRNA ligase [Cryobacterium psychrotolerans]MEC5152444.1 histidyl-tRNA synthetase [Cryobacterium psychrotolerans]